MSLAVAAPTPDPDDPLAWIAVDPFLTQAEAEWYADNWREHNARPEPRDPGDTATGLTRVDFGQPPSQN